MGKKARNKKLYKRIVPKMVKFENERIKQMLGMIPTPEDTRFSFRKYFQDRDAKADVQMTDMSDTHSKNQEEESKEQENIKNGQTRKR